MNKVEEIRKDLTDKYSQKLEIEKEEALSSWKNLHATN